MGNITAYTSFGITLNVLLTGPTQALHSEQSVVELDRIYWGCGLLKQFKMITVQVYQNETFYSTVF